MVGLVGDQYEFCYVLCTYISVVCFCKKFYFWNNAFVVTRLLLELFDHIIIYHKHCSSHYYFRDTKLYSFIRIKTLRTSTGKELTVIHLKLNFIRKEKETTNPYIYIYQFVCDACKKQNDNNNQLRYTIFNTSRRKQTKQSKPGNGLARRQHAKQV
jgi:hypothetical protein